MRQKPKVTRTAAERNTQVTHTTVERRVELARAKVNLTLHVTGQRPDGYHLLDSLVAFPQIGDRLCAEPADRLELIINGPFARNLDGPAEENLIVKAVAAFAKSSGIPAPKLRIDLTKRLPVASGIGGGSSNAATMLRLLEDITGQYLAEDTLHELALSLGADVPVCLNQEPQIMAGIGDVIRQGPQLPKCGIVLVNPKVEVSTPDVFRSMARRDNPAMPLMPEVFESPDHLARYLATCRNDLQEPAISLCPEIDSTLSALEGSDHIKLARMSGSGATCFGLCEQEEALEVERTLRASFANWWIAAGALT